MIFKKYLIKILASAWKFICAPYNVLYMLSLGAFFFLLICLFAVIFPIAIFKSYGAGIIFLISSEGKGEAIRLLGIAIGGSMLFLHLVIADRRAKAMEDSSKAQAIANENVERGQRQERLKNAIEHLGHESVSIRLGGAYELFHLAQDTKELRQTILDILCAHIRETTKKREYVDEYNLRPSEEIQSLLTLLFVRQHEVCKGLQINLQGSWLNGANLVDARLVNALLDSANLCGASLDNARLQGARFIATELQGVSLSNSNLQGATLALAMLQETNLRGAQLQGSWLDGVRLQGADLKNAMLQGAIFEEVFLQGAVLADTQLQGVTTVKPFSAFSFEATIRDCVGKGSDLSRVTFEGGLSKEDLDFLVDDLSDYDAQALRAKLTQHIDRPASHELPENSGAITGSYTKKEAEQWIAEYKKAAQENQ